MRRRKNRKIEREREGGKGLSGRVQACFNGPAEYKN